MKFHRKIKPSRVVAGPKDRRAGLHGAKLVQESVEVRKPFEPRETIQEDHLILYATDGYKFLRVDTGKPEDEGDVVGPIPAVALKHMERGVRARLGQTAIEVGTITSYARTYSETNPGTTVGFPPVDEVQAKAPEPSPEKTMTVTISAAFLEDLVAGMGVERITLTLNEDQFSEYTAQEHAGKRYYSGGIRVTSHDRVVQDEATGILMPMRPVGA